MIFDIKSVENKKIEKFYKEAIKQLNEFYMINWNRNMPRIFLIQSRKEFDILYGEKTKDWVVGTSLGDLGSVYLLKPEVYETESSHKYSDKEYEYLLRHEISHLYSRIFYSKYVPKWFMEGIAIYSSGQLELKGKIKKFERFIDFYHQGGSGLYDESGFAVMILDKEYGREKILELLKSLNDIDNEEKFNKVFKKIFGIELEYDWFNERISKYI
ncbi:hypothetical protein A3J98_01230 [candidate division WS6 bacterium RIFOXYC1_FULL_33_10]|uniref:Peptidase MA-like domain-containing protein n=2 Tax=Candidatus Dojkabacteria TaxID=74243 RepID=A0A1F4UIK3_9BACT|nr:MAG: hypothetical protein A2400_02615 [candidate division WS6 bacterium RIFOXYB1_FULL_33_14]OGC47431.1 MAG: hypothetical protein A3J98_01230 [candidate division WS6 bacterium RIFOXYC1_FULL_33_10]